MPAPAQTLLNNLISFTAKSSLVGGGYGGSVELTNEDNQYDETLRWTQLHIDLNASVSSTLADDTCFTGNVRWINGIIHEVSSAFGLSRNAVSLRVKSYMAEFKRKPVNTEYYNTAAGTVMTEVAEIFGGIPSALIDFTEITARTVYAVVSGNNLLEELQKLANVGLSDVFVQRDGILTTGSWKDDTDSVDYVLPNEAIISANLGVGSGSGPSRIVVRGRFISQFLCGEQVLSGGNDEEQDKPNSNDADKQGSYKKCMQQGIGAASTSVKVRNLRGNRNDLRNSRMNLTDGAQGVISRVTKSDNEGSMHVEIEGPGSQSGFLGQGSSSVEFDIHGTKKPEGEHEDPNSKQRPLRANIGQHSGASGNMGRDLSDLPISDPVDRVVDNDKAADEPDPIRIEMWVDDPDLQSEFGVVSQQIDNLYASDMSTLFDLAIRKFQEFKMARNTWSVSTAYLPCLKINDVVTFTTPDGAKTITGRLTQITVSYEGASPKASMRLAIQSFADIGSTLYVSQNLIIYPNMCGANGINWITTIDPSGVVLMMGGYVSIAGGSSGSSLKQPIDLEGGVTYTCSFSLTKSTGGSLSMSIPESSVSNSYGSTTNASFTFTATGGTNNLTWAIPGGAGWHMSRPVLTKQVTR